jgi:hypothetical protein
MKCLRNYSSGLFEFNFSLYCTDICRLIEVNRLISDINLLGNSSLKFFVRESDSRESSIEYYIENVVLCKFISFKTKKIYF